MTFNNCPFCFSEKIEGVLTAKDYTVSGERFDIWECDDCSGRFTQNVPAENEIGKYYQAEDYISHSDTSKGLVNRLYHAVRNHTLHTKRRLLEKRAGIRSGKVLDLGCGTGAFLNEMKSAGWEVEGIEPDEGARAKARQLYGLDVKAPFDLNTFKEASFDAITLWHVLEHIHELHDYIEQLTKLLKKNGTIFIAVPNYMSSDARVYGEFWAAYDVPRHLYHFSPQCLRQLMQRHELSLESMKPMWFDSFYISMLSEKYKTGKTRIPAAILRGAVSNLNALSNAERCSSIIYIVEKRKIENS